MKNDRALFATKNSAILPCSATIDADTSYGEAASDAAVRFSTSMCSTVTAPGAPPPSMPSPYTSGSPQSFRPPTLALWAARLAPNGSASDPTDAASRTSGVRSSSARCIRTCPSRPIPLETTKNSSALLWNARQPSAENRSCTSRYRDAWSIWRRCSLSLPSSSVHGPYPDILSTVSCTRGCAAAESPPIPPLTRSSPARPTSPPRPRRPSRPPAVSARTPAARAFPAP